MGATWRRCLLEKDWGQQLQRALAAEDPDGAWSGEELLAKLIALGARKGEE